VKRTEDGGKSVERDNFKGQEGQVDQVEDHRLEQGQ